MSATDLIGRVHRVVLDGGVDTDIGSVVRELAPLLSLDERRSIVKRVAARRDGLGPLEQILADPDVSEIMINGPGQTWVERHGLLERHPLSFDRDEINHLVERLVAPLGRRVDRSSPCVDGRLADGSRLHVVVPPIALDGPYVTIRRFVLRKVELSSFINVAGRLILEEAVDGGANVLVSGSTNAGKTTLLNAIATLIRDDVRIITVEDAAELRLPHPHVVRLEARPATAEGVGLLTIRDLVRNALRMRPDRLVVGEVRGGEALDLVQALNTGHRGCLATVHANSPLDALRRLETLALLAGEGIPLEALRTQLGDALDFIVQVERLADGHRRIAEISAVTGPAQVECVWACR